MAFQTIRLVVDEKWQGVRLDKCLAEMLPEHSRSWHQKHIKDGAVRYNGVVCTSARMAVSAGAEIEIDVAEAAPSRLLGEQIELPILFEDEHMLVINKPAGMVVHPGAGNWSGTVVNALLGRDHDFAKRLNNADLRPGIVHRLDKDTSGVLVVAKTEIALLHLTKAFAERKTSKTYATLVCGIPRFYQEKIRTMIGRHPVNRQKMAVVERNGKEAITEYDLLQYGLIDTAPVSFMSVRIMTGRTHQIRVHMAHCKLPVLGDKVYGGHQKLEVERQMLHAWKLKVPHPVNGHMMSFKAPLPPDFEDLLARIVPLPEQPLGRRAQQFEDDDDEPFDGSWMVDDDTAADYFDGGDDDSDDWLEDDEFDPEDEG